MLSVKGTFQNGVAQPIEPIEGHSGQSVIITFLEEDNITPPPTDDSAWEAMAELLKSCAVDTGKENTWTLGT